MNFEPDSFTVETLIYVIVLVIICIIVMIVRGKSLAYIVRTTFLILMSSLIFVTISTIIKKIIR